MRVETKPVIKITKKEQETISEVYRGIIEAYVMDDKAEMKPFAEYLEDILDSISDGLEHTVCDTTVRYED